ncbi:tetratricopeptide (TPR) repeat protein [Rhodanobacter sp. A1T4]|nr:tetratricopeptide (TPR) repeat protein [Rhodanobacter sp. A1T4]
MTKFKQLRHFTVLTASVLVLCGCAQMSQRSSRQASADAQPLAHLVVATPDAEHDLLAQLLAGEMALSRNDLNSASVAYSYAAALSQDPEVAERAARLAIAVHDNAAAQRALDRWQVLGATPVGMAEARAELALDRGDGDEARRQLNILISSGDKDAWRQFGRVMLGARDQAQAANLLVELATPQRLPADGHAWLAMSELGDKFGRHAYALQIAEGAMQRFKSAETYAWLAQMKFKDGDHDGARVLLQKAIAKAPDNIQLRLAYAGMLSQAGDYTGASKVLDHGPQNADTYALRVALAAQSGNGTGLATLYRELQKAPPGVREHSAYLLGQLAEAQHLNDEALAWYGQVDDDDAHAFEADLRSAVILQSQGKENEAHQALEQMQIDYLDQPAQLRQAYQVDAELYMRDQKYPQAVTAFSRALQVVPDDPDLLYGRGLAYAEAGNVDLAVKDFHRLLKLKPGDVDASNALGFTLADADRDLPEAEQLIQTARTAKPNDPAIADSWGWLQYRLGHLDQAAQVLSSAWQAQKDADVGVHLGEVLWKQGRQQEAQRVFDDVRKLDPTNKSLQDTLKRLHA